MQLQANHFKLLKQHLQAIVEVEFFTIPLYLTAVYSFTDKALAYTPDGGKTFPLNQLQQETLSVAVQEMYHLQCAANLANAFDVTPSIPQVPLRAGTELTIPHLEQNGKPLTTHLGNLPAVIGALIAIEKPDPHPFPPPNPRVLYASIADLYHATLQLLGGYLQAFAMTPVTSDPHFIPNHNQVAYGTFAATYLYNVIKQRTDAGKLANAIADQGEGHEVTSKVGGVFRSGGDGNVLPEFWPAAGTRFYQFGKITHYKRFENAKGTLASRDWKKVIGGPVFYEPDGVKSPDLPKWAASYPGIQDALNTIWSCLVDGMQSGFANGSLQPNSPDPKVPGFNDAMLSVKYVGPQIWQYGHCPSYVWRKGVTPAEVQAAMDQVDPLCLFHWDARTAEMRAQAGFEPNTCQGLNTCAGKGWGGIAATAGNGACATADLHTCGGNNDCRYEGGCGFLSTGQSVCGATLASGSPPLLPPSEQWIPDQNNCKGLGGCQAPISANQVFDRTAGSTIQAQTGPDWTAEAKQQLESLIGTNVWDHARQIFAAKEKIGQLPQPLSKKVGAVDYDGTARRAAVQATSV
ncbi:MAG: hypothetical protein IT167_07590 [Bryobacterales bacterium]|nr:hypothetical protein [Bryobacterales bacterium]